MISQPGSDHDGACVRRLVHFNSANNDMRNKNKNMDNTGCA